MEYRVAGLPQEIQDAIAEKHLMGMLAKSAAKPPVAKKQSMPATKQALQVGVSLDSVLNGCDQKQRDCAHARLALSAHVLHIHRSNGLTNEEDGKVQVQPHNCVIDLTLVKETDVNAAASTGGNLEGLQKDGDPYGIVYQGTPAK
ncbi:hypothetical protein A7P93_04725 [Eikenella corrodens]|nr:hypothetical protein A7P93_04725 [Eikenella corrodens]